MSCTSGSPCYNNQLVYSGCGNDPCSPNNRISCDGMVYIGSALPCTGIESCDTMCVALQKLDNAICNTPGFTVTASNGLYKDIITNDIRMGGPLTEQTVIGASNIHTLSVTGLVNDSSPTTLVSITSLGVLRQTSLSSIQATILAAITANNGVTKTGNLIQLGGPLIKPTIVTVDSTNTLSVPGLVTDNTETYVVAVDPTTGLLTKRSVASIVAESTIAANNGVTNNGGTIQLGGTLIQPTTITTSNTNTLTIGGLAANTTPTGILTTNGSGVMTTTSLSALLNNLTADNGLNKSTATNVQLGGTLLDNTTVNLVDNILYLKSSTFGTGIALVPGAPEDNYVYDTNKFYGKNYIEDNTWFQSNVGIDVSAKPSTDQLYGPRLFVNRGLGAFPPGPTFVPGIATTHNQINLYEPTGTLVNLGGFSAGFDSVNFFPGTTINFDTLFPSASPYSYNYTASSSVFSFGSVNNIQLKGTISAMTASGYFITASGQPGGNLDKFVTCRLLPAFDDNAQPYAGQVQTLVGLEIGDQKHWLHDTKSPGQSYGIQQLGTGDENKFFGNMNLQKVISNGSLANDAAAAAAGVPVGGLYHTTGTIKIRLV
jgi:hypothetical protein